MTKATPTLSEVLALHELAAQTSFDQAEVVAQVAACYQDPAYLAVLRRLQALGTCLTDGETKLQVQNTLSVTSVGAQVSANRAKALAGA